MRRAEVPYFWSVISFCNFWDTYDLKSIFWNKNDEIIKSVLLYTKVWSGNAPLLLAPVETCRGLGPFGPCWGSFGPCYGLLAPSLRIKSYLYTNIIVMREITKITIMPLILAKLTWNFLCIILEHNSTKKYKRPIVNFCL